METTYLTLYDEFLKAYDQGTHTPASIGRFINELTQKFNHTNLEVGKLKKKYNDKRAAVYKSLDETGKALTDAKAKIASEATQEYADLDEAERHKENLEKVIMSCYSLRKGEESETRLSGGY